MLSYVVEVEFEMTVYIPMLCSELIELLIVENRAYPEPPELSDLSEYIF